MPLSLSTLADQVGACCAVLAPLLRRIEAHVLAASACTAMTRPNRHRRCWTSRDRGGEHPKAHLAGYTGLFQADAYGRYGKFYETGRTPGPNPEGGLLNACAQAVQSVLP